MTALRLSQVGKAAAGLATGQQVVQIDQPQGRSAAFDLLSAPNGQIEIRQRGELEGHEYQWHDQTAASSAKLTATLRYQDGAGRGVWFILPGIGSVGINGLASPLSLAKLEPGALLSFGDQFWYVSAVWIPFAFSAPPELQDKPCPVCGAPLGEALVVQCACGRYMHLENADSPESEVALNCFLAARYCGSCKQPTSLAPQVTPTIPSCLLAEPCGGEDWDLLAGVD